MGYWRWDGTHEHCGRRRSKWSRAFVNSFSNIYLVLIVFHVGSDSSDPDNISFVS